MSTATKKRRKPSVLDQIAIRRPVPSPEVLQDAGPPVAEPFTAVNPEFEQKPLAELNLQTSEDFHGGSELTFSMPSQRGGSQQNTGDGGGAQQQAQESGRSADQTALQQQNTGGGGGPKDARQREAGGSQQQEGSSAGSPQSGEGAEVRQQPASGGMQSAEGRGREEPASAESGDEGEGRREPTSASRQELRGGDAGQQSGQEGAYRQTAAAGGDVQQKFDSKAQQMPEDGTPQRDAQQQQGLDENVGAEEERGDVRELGKNVKDGGGGGQTGIGVFNTAQVVDVETERTQKLELRRLQTEFYRLLEMLAEEKTKYFDPSLVGSLVKAEYNVKKMALRRYEGKPPTRYKAPRVREAVVLILDNSGSMESWADMLRAMAELAARRRDVEVYLAPNGYVEEQIAPVRRKVKHEDFMKKTSGRKIIYVGDFDGANTPIELSWRNEVIWIAPESRYKRFLAHSWVEYDESKYKGAFIRAFTIDDVMKGLKKVIGGVKWIDRIDMW